MIVELTFQMTAYEFGRLVAAGALSSAFLLPVAWFVLFRARRQSKDIRSGMSHDRRMRLDRKYRKQVEKAERRASKR